MNNCLEKAMSVASESYSHTVYDLEDFGCAEDTDKMSPAPHTSDAMPFTSAK